MLEQEERIVAQTRISQDDSENVLRPRVMSDYIGQEKIKHNLNIFMTSARKRGEALTMSFDTARPGLAKPP